MTSEREWHPKTRDLSSHVGHDGFQKGPSRGGGKDGERAFIQRAARVLGVSATEIPDIFSASGGKAYRINPLGFEDPDNLPDQIVEVSEDLSMQSSKQLDWYSRGFIFDAKYTASIQKSVSGNEGKIFIQTPSSFLPVHALLGESKETMRSMRILDLCAAPGGKTSLIAAETRDDLVEIIANDPKGRRSQRMQEVLRTLHIPMTNMSLLQEDGLYLPSRLGGGFDRILVDAECSTDSGVNFTGKNPLGGWSLDRVQRLTSVQRKLALAAYDGLRPGGSMVYSTCTLSPEENEGVIAGLLSKRPEVIIQPIGFDEEQTVKAIKKWEGERYPEAVTRGVMRIFPQEYMDSFCLALLHKPTGNGTVDSRLNEMLDLNEIVRGVR